MSLLALRARGVFSAVDHQLAEFLARQGASEVVQWGAALASRAVREGHVCADLRDWVGPVRDPDGAPVGASWPSWEGLADSPFVGGAPDRPLILEGSLLYLARYHDHEQALAASLRGRAERVAVDERALEDGIALLFDRSPDDADQRDACRVAARHRLCVVTGGPGTGKTRTVARLIALIQQQHHRAGRPCRVRLLAPTGKAAARMAEALAAERDHLPESMRAALPDRASTVHRALGPIGGSRTRFRRGPDSPLPDDVVVVDEASMVDLALMRRLASAVQPHARFVLLGDRHQLASVESGAVLGEVARAAEAGGRLAGCVVTLRHSFRFDAAGGIGALADAIREGDVDRALSVLEAGQGARLVARGPPHQLDGPVGELVAEGYRGLLAARTPSDGLAAMGRFRLLCAHRRGPWGVDGLNLAVERRLRGLGLGATDGWYPHRPVLVTANDYRQDLFNGDQGLAMAGPQGLRVSFPGAGGELRHLSPSRLEHVETVFALSVHKSQGSEFDRVVVVLPPSGSPLLSRELVYTAVTRARSEVVLVGEPEVVAEAIRQPVRRSSGLLAKLS